MGYRTRKPTSRDSHPEHTCEKCGGHNFVTTNRGYSAGLGLLGLVLAGPLGLIGGVAGGNQTRWVCTECGRIYK